jgi:hypothetical protein
VSKCHEAYEFAVYSTARGGELYVEHNVTDEDSDWEGSEYSDDDSDDVADGVRFYDSEDERATALDDGFGVNPLDERTSEENNKKTVVGHVGCEGKFGDEAYASDELGSSDPDNSDEERGHKYPKFRKEQLNEKYEFEYMMEFKSLDEFREAIRHWHVLNGYAFSHVKNENYRVRLECKKKCGYKILCSKVGDKETYAIKTKKEDMAHTCIRSLNNKCANSKWVSKAVVKKMQTSEKVRMQDIILDMRRNYVLNITPSTAYKARKIAMAVIEGDADSQYAQLWRYAEELRRACRTNTIKINVNRPNASLPPRFGSFYFSFDGCKRGFINGCRPFIGVDGCHLKTKYGGQLLIAVGRDPNDCYFPLAFGVVETETKESWRWFLQLLMEDLGQANRFVFISDQQKV